VEKKMHRLLDRCGDFRARRGPDRLERLAGFAEDDFALALALDIEGLLTDKVIPDAAADRAFPA
jgi:hypothetical protein